MKHHSAQKGFALIEILLVVTILSIVASLTIPNITPNSNKDSVDNLAYEARSELQRLANESWLSGFNYQVINTSRDGWLVLSEKKAKWVQVQRLFTDFEDISYSLNTKNHIDLGDGKKGEKIVFLTSGEYTDFELTVSSGSYSKVIYGDGINDIKIK